MSEAHPYLLGGYVLTHTFERPDPMSAALLPDRLLSISECLSDFAPGIWALDWTKTKESDRIRIASDFGLSGLEAEGFFAFATEQFGWSWGWPHVIYRLHEARAIAKRLRTGRVELHLLGIGLPADLAPAFLEHAAPSDAQEGPTGFYTSIKAGAELDPDGTPLGWEILCSDFGGFHSWLCNGLEKDVASVLEIVPNAHGFITDERQARIAAEYCGRPEVAAEPGLWQPWLIVDYPLAEATGTRV